MTDAADDRAGYLPEARWSVSQFLLVFGAGLIASFVVGIVAIGALGEELPVAALAGIFAAQAGASLGVMWWLSRTRGSGSLRDDFGLRLELSDFWAVFAGMGLQVGVAVLTAPLIYLLFGDDPPQQDVAAIAADTAGVVDGILIVGTIGVFGPVVEEMMFRGMLLARATRSFRTVAAVLVTAGAFALVHLLDPNAIAVLPGLFIIGVVLAVVALRRGDLSLAVPLHIGVNLTAALLLLFGDQWISWLEDMADEVEAIVAALR